MSCARVRAAVSGFEGEFGGRVQVRTIPNDSEEGMAARTKYDLQSHGIVLFSPAGELIYKRSEHRVNADEVHLLLKNELALHDAGTNATSR